MHEDLVRRWQQGWSASRGWTAVDEADGILAVKIGEEHRAIEYVVLDPDAHPERIERAAALALDGEEPAWVTAPTLHRGVTSELLQRCGLRVQSEPEWLMTIALADQPAIDLDPAYTLAGEPHDEAIVIRAMSNGAVAASGRMVVVGTDAVADRIETEPSHRRRGLGSAVTAALVDEARRRGAERGVLIASLDGYRLYQKLGWQVVAEVVVARSR